MTSSTTRVRRVLFIALDGLRPDALQQFAPHMFSLGEHSRTTWNSRVAIPISAASWATVFTGLEHTRTGIANNAFTAHSKTRKPNHLALQKECTLFQILSQASLSSLLVSTGSWKGICTIGEYAQSIDTSPFKIVHISSADCTEYQAFVKGCRQIRAAIQIPEWSCLTLYTDCIDSVGHQHGFCTSSTRPYAKIITRVDKWVQWLLQTVEARERTHGEEWLVVVTTDHGGSCRRCLQRTSNGRHALSLFDQNSEIHAGISQKHEAGIHGIRNDRSIKYQHTRTFVIVRVPRRSSCRIRGRVTNADITPTIVQYLLPESNHKRRILHSFDGRPISFGRIIGSRRHTTTTRRKGDTGSRVMRLVTSRQVRGAKRFWWMTTS